MYILECYSKYVEKFDCEKDLTRKGCEFEYAVPVTFEMYWAINSQKIYSAPIENGVIKVFCFKCKMKEE